MQWAIADVPKLAPRWTTMEELCRLYTFFTYIFDGAHHVVTPDIQLRDMEDIS